MLDFMTANIDEHYLEALKKYYMVSGDTESKIVDFTSPQISPFLQRTVKIGSDKENFFIIDGFSGIKPVVFNHQFLAGGSDVLNFQVGIILDSQVVAYLHQYVTDNKGDFRKSPRGAVTEELIKVLASYSKVGWDFNPLFYFAEAIGKSQFDKFFPFAKDYGATIQKLQTMDDDVFIECNEIVPNTEKINRYNTRYGNISFEEASASMAKKIASSNIVREMEVHIQCSYASLMKIGLLQHKPVDSKRKVEELFNFFHKDIGAFGAYEAIMGCLHFARKSGKFIPVEKGSKDIQRKLMASAWDLQLLRLPEKLIANQESDPTSIYYVCTAEKVLQKLGEVFLTQRVSSLKYGNGTIPSRVAIDENFLIDQLGEDLFNVFYEQHLNIQRTSGLRRIKTSGEILKLIDELEKEVQAFVII